jgi:hypothetical protein
MVNLAWVWPTGTRLRVLANDHEVQRGRLRGGRGWFKILPLAGVPLGPKLKIEILSETFRPDPIGEGSADTRCLGVLVRELRLLMRVPSSRRV